MRVRPTRVSLRWINSATLNRRRNLYLFLCWGTQSAIVHQLISNQGSVEFIARYSPRPRSNSWIDNNCAE